MVLWREGVVADGQTKPGEDLIDMPKLASRIEEGCQLILPDPLGYRGIRDQCVPKGRTSGKRVLRVPLHEFVCHLPVHARVDQRQHHRLRIDQSLG